MNIALVLVLERSVRMNCKTDVAIPVSVIISGFVNFGQKDRAEQFIDLSIYLFFDFMLLFLILYCLLQ